MEDIKFMLSEKSKNLLIFENFTYRQVSVLEKSGEVV